MSTNCLICGFDKHAEDAEYCQECGNSLENYCTNDHCDLNNGESIPCPVDARYCPFCGEETSYFKNGVIKPLPQK